MLRIVAILFVLAGLLAGAFLWSLSTRDDRADFTFINRAEVGTLDPNRISWVQDIRVAYGLWEGLYGLEPATLKPVPGTAEKIGISPDGRTYTFHIRPEAKWSNGDPVVAGDFVFAWRRMLEQPGDYTYLFHSIRGAKDYQEAFAAKKPVGFENVGIRSPDARTLVVELENPVAYFPDLCAFVPFWPLHEKSMQKFWNQQTKSYEGEFTRPPNLVTNGPYRLASWTFREKLRLVANEHYWDRATVKSKTIDVLIAADPLWSFLKYDSGAADWLSDATGPIGSELFAKKRSDMHVFSGFGTYMYKLNCLDTLPGGASNPLKDRRVRKALALAIQRQGIVEQITRLGEPVASTFIPPGVFEGYSSPEVPLMDLAEAKRLLAEAGYPEGKGLPRLSILFNSEAHHADVSQYVRNQWLANLGIDIELQSLEVKVFRQRLHSTQYAIARASWSGDYNDISTFLDCYRTGSENNDTGWANARYDALLDQATKELDATKRLQIFHEAETLLLEEQPIIPMYHYVTAYLFRDNVKGLYTNPRNTVILKSVEVLRDR